MHRVAARVHSREKGRQGDKEKGRHKPLLPLSPFSPCFLVSCPLVSLSPCLPFSLSPCPPSPLVFLSPVPLSPCLLVSPSPCLLVPLSPRLPVPVFLQIVIFVPSNLVSDISTLSL